MRKIILTVISFIIMMNIAFASPHENGIDDFYFGQPIEEIRAQYELTNEEYNEKDGTIEYKAQVPSLDFYGMKINQPIILAFKNNELYRIYFSVFKGTSDEGKNLYNRILQFATTQYGKPALPLNIMTIWYTNKIDLSILYLDYQEKNISTIAVVMNKTTLSSELLKAFNH